MKFGNECQYTPFIDWENDRRDEIIQTTDVGLLSILSLSLGSEVVLFLISCTGEGIYRSGNKSLENFNVIRD